jgi:hypothetical protein
VLLWRPPIFTRIISAIKAGPLSGDISLGTVDFTKQKSICFILLQPKLSHNPAISFEVSSIIFYSEGKKFSVANLVTCP